MRYFPVFFDLRGQKVLVVGGGEIALRKISLLERTGAAITVVSPDAVPELVERSGAGTLRLVAREFEAADLDGVRLVIAATGRRSVNRWIANLSEARGFRSTPSTISRRPASSFRRSSIAIRCWWR